MINEEAILEVRDLRKYFPVLSKFLKRRTSWIKAIDGVSIRIRRGEIFGLVGESGCGKSTLGKTIHGIYRPSEGTVLFEGKDITDVDRKTAKAIKNRMQYVYQDAGTSLDPWWIIRSTLREPLVIHKELSRPEMDKVIEDILNDVGLRKEHLDRYPHEFSGGQQRRLGLARILTLSPSLIIFDEPTSGLDVSVQATILKLLKQVKDEFDLTYIFISHNLAVIRMMSDRVGVMYLGKVVEVGDTKEVFEFPKHPYTEFLLAAIPEPGRVKEDILLKGEPPSPENRPAGCCFWPRCQYATKACSKEEPQLRDLGQDHSAACFLLDR